MGQMVVTMQETFAGIRVVKSFAREEASGEFLSPQQQAAIPEHDAHHQGDGSHRPARGNDRRFRRRFGAALRLFRQSERGPFYRAQSPELFFFTSRSKP